jgi:hypothetical protein
MKQMASGAPREIEIASEWGPILAFIVLANAVTWLACLLLRSTFAAGHLWALFTFVFVTVWSPTVIALALSFSFEGISGVRDLLGFLFRGFSKNNLWYLIGILVPVAAVASILRGPSLHQYATNKESAHFVGSGWYQEARWKIPAHSRLSIQFCCECLASLARHGG